MPQLRDYDNEILIVEMTLVSPPFLVDFGHAYLDALPEHASTDAAASRYEESREEFGDDWDEVEQALVELQCQGIYVLDLNPGNVRFR